MTSPGLRKLQIFELDRFLLGPPLEPQYVINMSSDTNAALSPAQKEVLKRAKDATEKQNHDYAIALLMGFLKEAPANIDARRRLRINEIMKAKGTSAFVRSMNQVKVAPAHLKGKNALKKNPQEALNIAEEILQIDPHNVQGNSLLAEAAAALGLGEVVVLAYETLREAKPTDIDNLKKLGVAYIALGESEKAQSAFQKVLDIKPNDGEAIKGMKDAAATTASNKGGWETGSSFKDSLKNSAEAAKLEQESKAVKSEEAIDEQIRDLYAVWEENNENVDVTKKIAALYEQKKDIDNALSGYAHADSLVKGADPTIEKTIFDLNLKKIDQQIAEIKAGVEQASEAEKPAYEESYQQWQAYRANMILEHAKGRVAKYPTDLTLRFELGKALFDAEQFEEAVPELQQSLRQPAVRHKALNYLGLAYQKRRMPDLAINQFKMAKSEMVAMDALKKQVIYNLGLAYDESGKKSEALEEFKQIFEIDAKYRDVQQRVQASYQ